ncbi:RhoGAP domain-containing protein [Cavenderia fasciculata]|uniref:RhoGAP domain-containing protein n=1 Tax=Cavenderia fasciculata TaxID=261658 RepID=F4PS99_CACFS|nr:RhoGAP domain-containing protein [Cavenderia fasciculata]EGG20645.1 RhoGAP domain-containing protein [Cavenderia fasciculata]|eukprot:XP_004358495.1 RhoGAP domain-containing protein [Cavenderia fasciculata]
MRVGAYYSGNGQVIQAGGKVFGAALADLMAVQKKTIPQLKVPLFLHNGFRYIIQHGLEIEGIFRIAGTKERVKQLQMQLDKGDQIDFISAKVDPVDFADLIKIYFRELPDCLMQSEYYDAFIATLTQDRIGQVQKLRELVSGLKQENQDLLKELAWFLGKIAINHGLNKMTAENLGLVFGPNLLWKGGKATSTTDMMELMAGAGKIKLLLCGYKKTVQGIAIVEGTAETAASIWTADSGGQLRIFNSETYEKERDIDSGLGRVFTMVSVRDHAWIASSSGVSVWDRSGSVVKEFPGFHVSLAPVYSHGELRVWAGTEQKITVFSASGPVLEVAQTIELPGQFIVSIAEIYGPANQVWAGATNGIIFVFDKTTGAQIRELRTPARRNITCLTYHNGRVWAGSEDKMIFVIDPTDFAIIHTIQDNEMLMLNTFKPIASSIWTCSRDSAIRIFDNNAFAKIGQLDDFHTDAIVDAVFHWNNRKLRWEFWSASFDKSVCIWGVQSDSLPAPPPPPCFT